MFFDELMEWTRPLRTDFMLRDQFMLAPTTTLTATWPITGDVPDLLAIVTEQADTISSQAALIAGYQGNLNVAQGQPGSGSATGTGTATGASLAVTGVTGTIIIGSAVTSTLVIPFGTTVLGQISGTTGGAGVYLTSNLTTASSTPVLFSSSLSSATATGTASGTSLTVTVVTGTIVTGSTVTSTALVPAGTTITSQQSGPTGGAGTYTTSVSTTASATPLSFSQPLPSQPWPVPRDADTLNLITQQQTAILRTQNALIQHYQDLLNTSQTAAPPTGP